MPDDISIQIKSQNNRSKCLKMRYPKMIVVAVEIYSFTP
jgi:hypothetical protein